MFTSEGCESVWRCRGLGSVFQGIWALCGSTLPSVRYPEQTELVNLEELLPNIPAPPSPRSASLWLFVAMTASLGPCMDEMLPMCDGEEQG